MSQFPTAARNYAPGGMPRLGETELIAPGVQIAPPDERGARMAEQLLGALRGVGNVAGQVGDMAQREGNEILRDRAAIEQEVERQEREAEAIDRGQASLDAAMMVPRFQQRVEKGEITYLPGQEEAATRDVLEDMAKGRSPAYRESLYRAAGPSMLNLLLDKSDKDEKIARADATAQASAAAVTASTPEELAQALDGVRAVNPDMTEAQAQKLVYLRALESHAKSGNTALFEMVMNQAQGLFPDEVEDQMRVLKSTNARIFNETEDAFVDTFVTSMMRGDTPDQLEEYVNSARGDGILSAKTELSLRNTIDNQREKVAKQQQEEQRKLLLQSFDSLTRKQAAADFLAGRAASMPDGSPVEDKVLTDPVTGKELAKVTSKEYVEAGMQSVAEAMDQQFGKDTPLMLASFAPLANQNSVVLPRHAQILADGFRQADINQIADANSINGRTVQAFELFKKLTPISMPYLLEASGGGDTEIYRLFSSAARWQQITGDSDPRTAIYAAIRSRDNMRKGMGVRLPSAQERRIASEGLEIGSSGVESLNNGSALVGHFNNIVDDYIAYGHNSETAFAMAKQVINELYIVDRKHAIFVGRENNEMREALPILSEKIAEEWVKNNPGSGFDADDLAIAPDGYGNYYLTNNPSGGIPGLPVTSTLGGNLATFTKTELLTQFRQMNADQIQAARDRLLKYSADRVKNARSWMRLSPSDGLGSLRESNVPPGLMSNTKTGRTWKEGRPSTFAEALDNAKNK